MGDDATVQKGVGIVSTIGLLFCILVLTSGCTRRVNPTSRILADPSFPKDASLEEIATCYRREQEQIPPLKGLIEITLHDRFYKRFWAKWDSNVDTIKVEGFDLLGGHLFHFQTDRRLMSDRQRLDGHSPNVDVIFEAASSASPFQGSREEFRNYLRSQARPDMPFAWLTLIDWLGRFGLPDLYAGDEQPANVRRSEDTNVVDGYRDGHFSASHHIALEKQEKQYILYLFSLDEKPLAEEKPSARLDQKIVIEREDLRVTEVLQFDAKGAIRARMTLRDYRPIPSMLRFTGCLSTDRILFPYSATIEEGGLHAKVVFKEMTVPSALPDTGKNLSKEKK